MLTTEIKADGTIYWHERGNEWGAYLRSDYSRGPVTRLDDKRYRRLGSTWSSSYVEDPKGKFILVRRLDDDLSDSGRIDYVLPTQIRATYAEAKSRYEAQRAADKNAAIQRQQTIDAMNDRADALRDRLADLGLTNLIHVRVVEGNRHRGDRPRMDVEFGHNAEADLGSLLAYIENLRAL